MILAKSAGVAVIHRLRLCRVSRLLGNPPEITDEPITRIISKQLDVKLGPFTKEEL